MKWGGQKLEKMDITSEEGNYPRRRVVVSLLTPGVCVPGCATHDDEVKDEHVVYFGDVDGPILESTRT